MKLEWEDPPLPKPSKCKEVLEELKKNPGRWAKIQSGPTTIMPWWGPLRATPHVEIRIVSTTNQLFGGPIDVYARYEEEK